MKRLVLIDGHAVIHRAYHALPKSLTDSKGKPVNAVYGFTRMLFKIFSDLKPTYLAAAFDLPKPTFRHKLFKEYQATRPKADDDLIAQIKPIHKMVKAFDIPIFEKAGFEADDVIGTLVKRAAKKLEIIIITGDKDIFQLIDKKTKVYALQRGIFGGELVDEKRVKEILGIKASQVVDYKALAGDPSDHYPGVNGIGPKTAIKLLDEFDNLEAIYHALGVRLNERRNHRGHRKKQRTQKFQCFQESSVIKKSIREKLLADLSTAQLSQKLAKIRKDVKLDFCLKECRINYNKKKVRKALEKFGFKSLIKKLEEGEKEQMKLL